MSCVALRVACDEVLAVGAVALELAVAERQEDRGQVSTHKFVRQRGRAERQQDRSRLNAQVVCGKRAGQVRGPEEEGAGFFNRGHRGPLRRDKFDDEGVDILLRATQGAHSARF